MLTSPPMPSVAIAAAAADLLALPLPGTASMPLQDNPLHSYPCTTALAYPLRFPSGASSTLIALGYSTVHPSICQIVHHPARHW